MLTQKNEVIISWVNQYSTDLFRWAKTRTSNIEVAEDLVQETFVAALSGIDKFEGRSNPRTWLLGILSNKINDFHRQNYLKKSGDSSAESSVILRTMFDENEHWREQEAPKSWNHDDNNILDDEEFTETLESCLKKLPADWRSILQLKYLNEKKGEIICQEMGITQTNFWQIVHRAKLQMRKCLEVNWFEN